MTVGEIVAGLWADAELPPAPLDWLDVPAPASPVLASSFRVDAAAQASVALAGLAAASLHLLRGGEAQRVDVDPHHAAMEFLSERLLRVDGGAAPELHDRLNGLYAARDGWVRIHTQFRHHREGVLRLLGCAPEREAVAAALSKQDPFAFEDEAAAAGLCATAFRTAGEWAAHPQSAAVATLPLVEIFRIGEAPAVRRSAALRPLGGVRVLDLTRVIAGPVCGRTLAAHGAEVLAITSPRLPHVPPLVIDNNRGKRTAALDLDLADDRATLETLLREADVFLQGYRRGSLAARGFGPAHAAAVRPGIVYASLNAYGRAGPWAHRRGFDSLVQTATGLNAEEMTAAGDAQPRVLPAQALDHATGHLLAFGVLAALHRQATEGGSWHVQVSLARTGQWLGELGRVSDGFRASDPKARAGELETSQSGFGMLTAVASATRLSRTAPHYARGSQPLGADPPTWS